MERSWRRCSERAQLSERPNPLPHATGSRQRSSSLNRRPSGSKAPNDEIHGSDRAFPDRLGGGPGDDVIYGHGGWDIIGGEDGDEPAISETPDGADQIYGGPGDDYLAGQRGADSLYGGDGNDMLISNEPQDLADLGLSTPPGFLDDAGARMFGGAGNDLIVGSNRWDRMQGGTGDDALWGFEGRDYIRGGAGNNIIVGGLGIDDTNGNTGNDHIIHLGADTTNGGFGVDRCESSALSGQERMRSCERVSAPTLNFTPPDNYAR